ncbi:hypothetical protein ACJX0J_016772, partial [Zea mays]
NVLEMRVDRLLQRLAVYKRFGSKFTQRIDFIDFFQAITQPENFLVDIIFTHYIKGVNYSAQITVWWMVNKMGDRLYPKGKNYVVVIISFIGFFFLHHWMDPDIPIL